MLKMLINRQATPLEFFRNSIKWLKRPFLHSLSSKFSTKSNAKKCLLTTFFLLYQSQLWSQPFEFSTVGNVYPSSKSTIGSQVVGRIDQIYVEVGQEVSKGQPIVSLDSTFFQIDLDKKNSILESAKIDLSDAETNYLRMKRLWEKNDGQAPSVSLKKYEEAKSKYDLANAQVKQDEEEVRRAQANLNETTIRAPFNGVISKKLIDQGESISAIPATPIIEIQSLTPVYLEFSIPQIYLNNVQVGTPIQFEIEGTDQATYTAKIDLIYPCLDQTTRSICCRAIISNQDKKILPGSFAKILIKGNKP